MSQRGALVGQGLPANAANEPTLPVSSRRAAARAGRLVLGHDRMDGCLVAMIGDNDVDALSRQRIGTKNLDR